MDVSISTPAEMVSVVKRVIEVPQDVVGGGKVGNILCIEISYCCV